MISYENKFTAVLQYISTRTVGTPLSRKTHFEWKLRLIRGEGPYRSLMHFFSKKCSIKSRNAMRRSHTREGWKFLHNDHLPHDSYKGVQKTARNSRVKRGLSRVTSHSRMMEKNFTLSSTTARGFDRRGVLYLIPCTLDSILNFSSGSHACR